MPLWALAHLRIDGDGMPGAAAMNGYYLLLAILLRPALIITGLTASAVIFGAVVYFLQTVFQDVLYIKGLGSVNGLEMLFYTLVFAYIAYSAGITSFKLVDTIPNQILRWIGAGVGTFSDGKEDPIGGSNQLALATGGIVGGQIANSLSQGASNFGDSIAGAQRQKSDQAFAAAEKKADIARDDARFEKYFGGGSGEPGHSAEGGGGGTPPPGGGGGGTPPPSGGAYNKGFGDGDRTEGPRGRYDNANEYTGGDTIDGDPPKEN